MTNPEERRAIRYLMARGRAFTLAFFSGANVSEDTLAKILHGLEVDPAELQRVKRVLKERLTEDIAKQTATPTACPTCGQAWPRGGK